MKGFGFALGLRACDRLFGSVSLGCSALAGRGFGSLLLATAVLVAVQGYNDFSELGVEAFQGFTIDHMLRQKAA